MITVYFIHYISGSGGNFLGRVFSLDDSIVGMGSNGFTSSTLDRQKTYNYTTIPIEYNNYKNDWVNYELEIMYFPLTLGVIKLSNINARIIQPVEPFNFYNKLNLFGKDDIINHLHVDTEHCIEWINQQKKHKGAHIVPNVKKIPIETTKDLVDLTRIIEKINSHKINLNNIISSDEGFITEYEKACDFVQSKKHTDIALEIYWSWKKTWANPE